MVNTWNHRRKDQRMAQK